MKDDNCIFCKLANGDIPTNMLYQDDDFAVIMDASPCAKGHALILPRNHFANIYEIDDETVMGVAKLAKKMAAHMKEVLGCDGMNILQNNGEAAGQTVFHYHVHLVPRNKGDEDSIHMSWEHLSFDEKETEEIKKSLLLN